MLTISPLARNDLEEIYDYSVRILIEFRDMILKVMNNVQLMVQQDMTYEQIAAAGPTDKYDARWGDTERFLRAVYTELGGE